LRPGSQRRPTPSRPHSPPIAGSRSRSSRRGSTGRAARATGRSYIEPGAPWQNPFVESFGSRFRDEVLSVESFDSVVEAQTVMNDWKNVYNQKRPHSSLGWKPPATYAASLIPQAKETPARLS